jgi:hypothetical protein
MTRVNRRRVNVINSRMKAFSFFSDNFNVFKSAWKVIRGAWSSNGTVAASSSQPGDYPIAAVKMSKPDVTLTVETPKSGTGAALWVTDSGNWWGVTHNRTTEDCNCQSCPVNYCSSYNCSYNYCSSYNCSINYCSSNNCARCASPSYSECCTAASTGQPCYGTVGGACCPATGWTAGYFYCGYPYTSMWACLYYNNNNNSGTYGCASRYYWFNCTTYWTPGSYYNYCSSYFCNQYTITSYNCTNYYCSSYNCYACLNTVYDACCAATSNGNCCAATSNGNCCGATYYVSCNCQTCYPVIIQVLQSVSNVVSQVTSWVIASAAAAIKVITSGTTITTKAYSDTAMVTQIGSDLVHTATGATVTTQFGILVSPSVYNQGTTVDNITIQSN